jgi:hypothetical protein
MTEESPEPPLPPVHEGHLDRAGLKQLFFDIEHAAQFLGARIKVAAGRNSSETECGLAEAFEALDTGNAMGVQLHYEHKQRLWCDTILRHAGGYRVVRVDRSLTDMGH